MIFRIWPAQSFTLTFSIESPAKVLGMVIPVNFWSSFISKTTVSPCPRFNSLICYLLFYMNWSSFTLLLQSLPLVPCIVIRSIMFRLALHLTQLTQLSISTNTSKLSVPSYITPEQWVSSCLWVTRGWQFCFVRSYTVNIPKDTYGLCVCHIICIL